MSLVERGGEVRSFHVKNATARTLRETAVKIASRKSYLMTDENAAYTKLGKEFSGHGTVNHLQTNMPLRWFRPCQQCRKLFFHFQARCDWDVPPH